MKNLLVFIMLFQVARGGYGQAGPLITTFPSLSIGTHSRGWAMGNTGIATSEGNQTIGYNIAKSAFTRHFHQASVTCLPWVRAISNDSRFLRADYLASVNSTAAIGFAINYLDLGNVAIRNGMGATLGIYHSNDYNIGCSYALQVGGNASIGITLRFLGSRYYTATIQNQYGVSGDIGYYQYIEAGNGGQFEWGLVVSNAGTNDDLPTNAGVGVGYSKADENLSWQIGLDVNRLLRDDGKGVRIGLGAEIGFAESFFMRGGIHLENESKGNRKFMSLGAGYKGFVADQSWGIDLHYLVPFGVATAVSPFENQIGLTLFLNIGNFQ